MSPRQAVSRLWHALPASALLAVGCLGLAAAALTVHLWPHWRTNPDLSHGYFVPFLFFLLLVESRSGTPRHVPPGMLRRVSLGALLTSSLLALGAAGLYAAAVDWTHALVSVMLALAFVLFTLATAVVFAGGPVRLFYFNWQLFAATALWLLATPIPPGTYSRLTVNLQLWVSESVLRTLHLLGIAAIRQGNIIDLATTSVGVEEACSGVRSLISCVFAGVFFSATLVSRPWARAVIIALSVPLALGMNFLRSLFLTLLANSHVDIGGIWHDATGFAVLGVTAVLLGGLALLCEHGRSPPAAPSARPSAVPGSAGENWTLTGAFGVAALVIAVCVWNSRPAVSATAPVPDLQALLPQSSAGWLVQTTDLFAFRGTLQTDHLAQRSYYRPEPGRLPTEIVIYVAYWKAGQAPVSHVASHTPDACWPGAGWLMVPNPKSQITLHTGNRDLPEAEHRVFESRGQSHHVWFWHIYDGRPIPFRDPYSAVELLRLSWKYGFRRGGDQFFVRISSNRPWEEIENAPPLREFLVRMQPLGL